MCSARSRKRDRGAVLLLAAVLVLVLVGVAALAVDLGQLHLAKARAQDVCDASALAAAWYLEPSKGTSQSPLTTTTATECADANNSSGSRKVLQAGSSNEGVTITFPTAKSLQVQGDVRVNFGFARLLGFNSSKVSAATTAELAPSPGFSARFVPLAVSEWLVNDSADPSLTAPKTLVTNRWKPGTNERSGLGNLFALSFTEGTYENLLQGQVPPFSRAAKSMAIARTDNIARATADGLNARLSGDSYQFSTWKAAYNESKMTFPSTSRLIIMPVLSSTDEQTVVGFTGFFVESAAFRTANDRYRSEYAEVTGYFVPGIVGSKSIRWLWSFQQDQPNLMYRVRLNQ